jgi:hypothetical protein
VFVENAGQLADAVRNATSTTTPNALLLMSSGNLDNMDYTSLFI